MSELSRQGMVKANLAAIACRDSQNGTRTWSLADMVRAGVEAYVAEVEGDGLARAWDEGWKAGARDQMTGRALTENPYRAQPKPWDNCPNPKPRTEEPAGYCQTCGGMMIVSPEGDRWIHPPKGWRATT